VIADNHQNTSYFVQGQPNSFHPHQGWGYVLLKQWTLQSSWSVFLDANGARGIASTSCVANAANPLCLTVLESLANNPSSSPWDKEWMWWFQILPKRSARLDLCVLSVSCSFVPRASHICSLRLPWFAIPLPCTPLPAMKLILFSLLCSRCIEGGCKHTIEFHHSFQPWSYLPSSSIWCTFPGIRASPPHLHWNPHILISETSNIQKELHLVNHVSLHPSCTLPSSSIWCTFPGIPCPPSPLSLESPRSSSSPEPKYQVNYLLELFFTSLWIAVQLVLTYRCLLWYSSGVDKLWKKSISDIIKLKEKLASLGFQLHPEVLEKKRVSSSSCLGNNCQFCSFPFLLTSLLISFCFTIFLIWKSKELPRAHTVLHQRPVHKHNIWNTMSA